MIVSDTRYGRTKARKHAQTLADRSGKRVHLQLDRRADGKLEVLAQSDRIVLWSAPFTTFYPATTKKEVNQMFVAILIHSSSVPPDVFGPFDTEDEARRYVAWHRGNEVWNVSEIVRPGTKTED